MLSVVMGCIATTQCSSDSMASFCCPIEMEPKTLSQGQLIHARDVAVDIVQKKESIEASHTFDVGMTPVIRMKEMASAVEKRDSICKLDDQGKDETETETETGIVTQTICQCSLLTSAIIDSPDQVIPKEPLSAPF